MTSVQTMFNESLCRARWFHRAPLMFAVLLLFLLLPACQKRLYQPDVLAAPYPQTELWAVAPFANESGVSIIDRNRVADLFTQQVQQIEGVDTVPVNRVIAAMRALGLNTIESEMDIAVLMNTLDVDAMIVGTITAWDPYRPPTLGAAVELYRSDANRRQPIDPIRISRSPSGNAAPGKLSDGPAANASGIFDANNHTTLAQLERYARSRTHPDSAYGIDIYLVSMDLYMQFVSYRLLRDLLEYEWVRLTPIVTADDEHNTR